jgi:hypothetical protein
MVLRPAVMDCISHLHESFFLPPLLTPRWESLHLPSVSNIIFRQYAPFDSSFHTPHSFSHPLYLVDFHPVEKGGRQRRSAFFPCPPAYHRESRGELGGWCQKNPWRWLDSHLVASLRNRPAPSIEIWYRFPAQRAQSSRRLSLAHQLFHRLDQPPTQAALLPPFLSVPDSGKNKYRTTSEAKQEQPLLCLLDLLVRDLIHTPTTVKSNDSEQIKLAVESTRICCIVVLHHNRSFRLRGIAISSLAESTLQFPCHSLKRLPRSNRVEITQTNLANHHNTHLANSVARMIARPRYCHLMSTI